MMKKVTGILLVSLFVFTSCILDDSYEVDTPTNFDEDISKKTEFLLSTPIELKITNLNEIENVSRFDLLDTLKFHIKFNAKYRDNLTDTYDIFQSTGATKYLFHFSPDRLLDSKKVIDLDFVAKNPEVLNLSNIEIKTSPVYKKVFFENSQVILKYDSKTEAYEANFGVIFTETTFGRTFIKDQFFYNSKVINKPTDKQIVIGINVVDDLDDILVEVK